MPPVPVGPKIGPSHSLPPAHSDAQDTAQSLASSGFADAQTRPQWFNALPEIFQTRLFAATEAATATAASMIQGAEAMASVVTTQFHLAARRVQTIGPEIEFLANRERTEIIRAIALRYQAAGYQTREIATPYYEFEAEPHGFWETRHHFEISGGDIAFHLYEGVGGFVVSAKAPFGVQADILSTGSEKDAFDRGCVLAAEMLHLPVAQVRDAALAGKQRYLLALKSTDKDYFEIQVELGANGVATLTPLTGKFLNAQGQPQGVHHISATTLEAVKDYLVKAVAGKKVLKNNAVTTIEVQVPGRAEPLVLDNRFDVYPIQEVVPSPLAAGEHATLMAPLLDFFNTPGTTVNGEPIELLGTNGINQVGFQVHREIQWLNGQGQPTIEYALKLQRAWIAIAKDVAAAVPTLEARTLFARPLPDHVANIIMDPNFVTDPTSVAQTFDWFGLIVRNTLPKYHDMNLENWFAHHVKILRDMGLIQIGDIIPSVRHKNIDYIVGDDNVTMTYVKDGDRRHINLIRVPSSHPIPTAELRTPDTVLNSDYMRFFMDFMAGFGHDVVGTASKEVAQLHQLLQQPGNEAVARDFANHPGLPLSIMTLLGLNIPELLVAYRLKGLVGDAAVDAMAPYQALRTDPLVGTVVESIRASGLAAVMGPDATKDPIAQGLHHLIEAGKRVAQLIEGTYLDGAIPAQKLGVEAEFNPTLGRDAIFEIIANAYRNIPDASVTLQSSPDFNFTASSPLHWTISLPVTAGGQTILAKVASGTGGYIISAIRNQDDATTRAANSHDVLGALYEAQNLVRDWVGPQHPISTSITPDCLMMCKSTDGDYLKMTVVFRNGTATLTALNGDFNGKDGPVRTLQIPAHELGDVERFLQANAGAGFARKDDKIARMEVQLPGNAKPFELSMVYEEHPSLEAVTGILDARSTDIVRHYLAALSDTRVTNAQGQSVPLIDGMRSGSPLAFHVHAEIPYLDASGKMTIAAFLQLQRNFSAMTDEFSALLGPDANRVAFAQKAPDHYVTQISDPNYVKDPTHFATILNVFGDYITARPAKYQDFSAEHFTSWFLRTLIQQGKLQMGQTITTEWQGQTITFSVRPDADGAAQIYRGVQTDGGFTAEQEMIRLSAHQPTAELRLPNALYAAQGRTAEYVEWLLRATTAFVQTHAQLDSKTLSPKEFGSVSSIAQLISSQIENPATVKEPVPKVAESHPTVSQAGFTTIDTMANIATLGAIAAVEKIVSLNTKFTAAATSVAKGGAIFLLGDIGSNVVMGDTEALQQLSIFHIAKDYALLTFGGEPARMATTAALNTKVLSALPTFLKSLAGRTIPLFGALAAQEYGNTGTIDIEKMPQSLATVMAASGIVQGAIAVAGTSSTLTHLAQVLRLAKVGTGPTVVGAVAISVAEFTLIKGANRLMENAADVEQRSIMTGAVGELLTAAANVPALMTQGKTVPQSYIATIQKELDAIIASLDQGQTLEEYRILKDFAEGEANLQEWRHAKMGKTLDGTFTYGEIEERFQKRMAELIASRKQDLAELTVDTTHVTPLPVNPSEDWASFVDAVDEDQLKATVDLDGNSLHDDPTPLRYQALLSRHPRQLAQQLRQFKADWMTAIQQHAPIPPRNSLIPQILAQR